MYGFACNASSRRVLAGGGDEAAGEQESKRRFSGASGAFRRRLQAAVLVMAVVVLCAAQAGDAQAVGVGAWNLTGSMSTPRSGATATLLGGPPCKASPRPAWCGKVLVAAGTNTDAIAVRTAELYNPKTGLWETTGLLDTARSAHAATQLSNGQVLVVGGRGDNPYGGGMTSSELYDPDSGTWSSCPTDTASTRCPAPMNAARYDHTATLLANGNVLVAGGALDPAAEPTAELYNPSNGRWTATGQLNQGRYQHSATRLAGG
ncbi:MAG: hypothetical protein LC808_20745, partial [Actinobacteria bacterium]|nr:hypothetical protein [Actinomycetota bacterium]